MAQNDPQSGVWTNPLPTSVSQDLEIIFESLSNWLANPTFQTGITVGNGTAPVYDPTTGTMTTPAPSTVVNLNSFTQAPSDTSAPGTPSVTAVGGIRSILAYWTAILTANGSPVASYVAQVSTNNTFTAIVETLDPVGPVASFDNLTANTTYYVRVAAVSYKAVQGPWSSTVTVTTPQVVAGDIAANTIIAGSAIIGSAAISSAQIASITANQITAGTINAQTVQLGATGGTAAIQSTNFVTGTTGWAIKGDGSAEFSNVTINNGTFSDTGSYVDSGAHTHNVAISAASGVMTWTDNDITTPLDYKNVGRITVAEAGPTGAGGLGLSGGRNVLNQVGGSATNFSDIQLGYDSLYLDASNTTGGQVNVIGTLSANTMHLGGTGVLSMASGTASPKLTMVTNLTYQNGGVGGSVFTFPTAYASAPQVMATLRGAPGTATNIFVTAVTATGFTAKVYNGTTQITATNNYVIDYIALG